ncbi:MAG: RNA-directed DNA polymerase [Spirochaetaceae bacterium]|jgi:hypothetical protein|nr:RNA-directed DNA polymerase [Spirochaetaceae bacterium]
MRHSARTACGDEFTHKPQTDAVQGFFINMTSEDRKTARAERRRAARTANEKQRIEPYNDFSLVADADNLARAFAKSKRGVSWKESVQRYEANALRNIAQTRRKLLSGESVQSGFVEFDLKERGKTRHIRSVHISERVVQKCLCDKVLAPLLSRPLIHDNGASIAGKGVHFALRRLVAHLSRFYRSNGRSNEGHALLVDFSIFFDNIRHDALFAMQERYLTEPRLRALTRGFISAFGDDKSLGLGSQVSQICAIFYPNALDHCIKEKLRVKYYGRYMDDLCLIHADKAFLEKCLAEIKTVCARFDIVVNEKKTRIVRLSSGVPFLKGKYALLPSGKILRRPGKESAKRMRRKLKAFKKLADAGKMDCADVYASYQSWRGGYAQRFNAHFAVKRMDALYDGLFINTHPQ